MTENTGWPPPEPGDTQAAVPEPELAPETPADPAAPAEAPAPEQPAETLPPPEVPAPFIPDTGVADWLREAFHDIDRRLRNAGF